MTVDSVHFSLDGVRYTRTFDRTRLALGRAVYVTVDSKGEPVFRPDQAPGSRRLHVQWIAPSEWYVVLQADREASPEEVDLILRSVDYQVPRETVERAAAQCLARIRAASAYTTREQEKTEWTTLLRVATRLDFCQRLANPDVGRALFAYWAPAMEYHFLTCFDLLGQPDDWVSFHDWLASASAEHALQRDTVLLESASARETPHQCAIRLSLAHNRYFGVRQSFRRFFRDVLPDNRRAELFASITIHRLANPPAITDLGYGDDDDKEAYLYRLRNEYTHRGLTRMGTHPELFPEISDDTWLFREQEVRGDHWVSISTRGWPEALRLAVLAGLASRVTALGEATAQTAAG